MVVSKLNDNTPGRGVSTHFELANTARELEIFRREVLIAKQELDIYSSIISMCYVRTNRNGGTTQ